MNATEALARVKNTARMAAAEAAVTAAVYESERAARDLPDAVFDRARITVADHAADQADTWARCATAAERTMLDMSHPTAGQIDTARRVAADATDRARMAERQLRELHDAADA